jgi:nucleoside-diphosphate-sugar epimerase
MKTARQGVFAWFVRQALDGEEIKLFGGGDQLRDFNHVSDVVAALILTMQSPATDGEFFNLGSKEPKSLLTIANTIVGRPAAAAVRGIPYPPHLKAIEIGDYIGDLREAQARAGLGAGHAAGSRASPRRCAYYKAHRDHYWQQVLYP